MIKGIASKHISKAFSKQLSDAVDAFDGSRIGTESRYDPDEDRLIAEIINYSSRGVFSSYKNTEIDGSNVRLNDVKLLCLQDELDTKPAIGDKITSNDKSYQVINVSADPAEVTYTMQLRGIDDT